MRGSARSTRSYAACERLTGYPAAELAGRSMEELIPEDEPAEPPIFDLNSHAPRRHERALLSKAGERRLVSWSNAAIRDESGTPRYLVSTGIDVTESRRAEARARELQHHLYRIGRISELGEMASAIAHELNQPMTAVGNYVNASRRLLESVESDKAEQIVGLMNRAVEQTERAGQIVRRLRRAKARWLSSAGPMTKRC
jgi:two-component system, LuxR family, sensor kinase FixL